MTERLDLSDDPPARILIVDDEPLNLDYLEQELEGLGFAIETAADGLQALERVAAAPPDLVLLDVMMPRMDGISVLRVLKEDPDTRLIPVVLMTALNAVDDRVRGIEAGADDFLTKPVDERELLARIRTALSTKRAIDETVGELRSASAHLERYGRQEREVAIVAIDWRLLDPRLPEEAVRFLGRRQQAVAEERIVELGGITGERGGDDPLVAVFDASDAQARASAAVAAARAVVADSAAGVSVAPGIVVNAAVAVGRAEVGSTRVGTADEARWVYAAAGDPVERASSLARGEEHGVLVTGEVAALVRGRFRLEPAGDAAFRVIEPTSAVEESGSPQAERRMATLLVTDIVGSTKTAERVGDRVWGELIAGQERATRSELAVFGGDEIDTAGDGFLASFDSPASAIRCALAVLDRLATLGLTIRAGLHSGEVELVEGRMRGIALHIANRVAGMAGPGEVLVSATTRELAAGSGLVFVDRGEHLLKGLSEPRRLYAAIESPARRAAEAAREAQAPPSAVSAASTTFPAGLTAREVDVLRLVAAGLSDAEAAHALFLSVRTVNAHLRSVYRKIGVRSRAAAGRFADEHGLL